MSSDPPPVALITGGSSGLGYAIARAFIDDGYRVMIAGRDQERLGDAISRLGGKHVSGVAADITSQDGANELIHSVKSEYGRLDVLINCVGGSDRGLIENLTGERLIELIQQNVLTALYCSQAALPLLESSGGAIVNIGSLAAKVGARYIGGYAAAKHALAGMTQQMRLELSPKRIHVGLVNPGPIRRDDSGTRYQEKIGDELPDQAKKPGAGTRVKGLSPDVVAACVLQCAKKRKPDVVLPRYLRLLIGVGHLSPRLGDWLLLKFTSSRSG
ncbi:MAG: SDR family oxidoreductase [Pirellulaceae bacterium]|nr:SDR family oxidoreductase [Pirellulaceae bacterium]